MNTVSILRQENCCVSDSVTERRASQRLDLRAIDERHLAATKAHPALAFEALQVPRDDLSSRTEFHRDILVRDLVDAFPVQFEISAVRTEPGSP